MTDVKCDVLIVGGGLGGVAAALSVLEAGKSVTLTEECDWLGGQLTTQAVPPDEHDWIEQTGCTSSYRRLRNGIRDYYRRNYPLLPTVRCTELLNPGSGNVSPLCHEPHVAVAVIGEMLAPFLATGKLTILMNHKSVAAETSGDRITSVRFSNLHSGAETVAAAPYVLDATELGDLLPLADVEHVIGSESQDQTGEPSALPDAADPFDQQAVSWCFAISYHPGEDHTIERPEDYDFWRDYQPSYWPAKQLSWTTSHPMTLEPETRGLFAAPTDATAANDLWHYRRIFYRRYYPDGLYPSDIVMVNWPQLDYTLGPIVGGSSEDNQRHIRGARQLALSLMFWMQSEAPRHDGGTGYPGLRLRGDILGTDDGLTKYPYVREGRRIKALFTVTENHVGVEARKGTKGAEIFSDSVGIGSYRIDLHPSSGQRNYVDLSNWPFQIPLGSLIPCRVQNLLAAGKSIGTTHITNGCYRLHPVEWNIGEAAGVLAAYCLDHDVSPAEVYSSERRVQKLQSILVQRGVPLEWPEEIRLTPRDKLFGVVEHGS
ncbi:MAG: FAD-dependent oxidoreductase [Trueperaceae bacterium]